jgi:exodeoxyribonuclease VII large subunit
MVAIQANEVAWSVTQLARASRRLIEGGLGALWVRGEISGFKAYQSGHWYFTLRDAESQVRCTMWRTHALRVGTPPPEGAQVFVFGAPTVWEEKGEFRFNVTELLTTDALGRQHRLFEKVKATLERDGLLDPARKRPLPAYPRCLAVVTSLDGAALRDIITVARKRAPGLRLLVVGTKVQGVEAEAEIAKALGRVNRLEVPDLCLLARGGGSREDLGAFNSEIVCRALAAVRIPTVSAVGHETDLTLADLVADLRAPTPSAAIEQAVPDFTEVAHRAAALGTRLAGALRRRTRVSAERLARTADRLEASLTRRLSQRRHHLERLTAQLDALSPLRVLERGYGVALSVEGRVLRRRHEFPPGLPFRLRISDGTVPARVEPSS